MVLLTRHWAIKFPTVMYGWKMFLYGLLGNMNERVWSGQRGLCPVRWSGPLGLVIVMPRCQPLTDAEFCAEVSPKWGKGKAHLPVVENKADSFGRLNGKIVAVDYGGFGWEVERCRHCGLKVL